MAPATPAPRRITCRREGRTASMRDHSSSRDAASTRHSSSVVGTTLCAGMASGAIGPSKTKAPSLNRSISNTSCAALSPGDADSPPTTDPSSNQRSAWPRSPSSIRRPLRVDEESSCNTSVKGNASMVPWSATGRPPAVLECRKSGRCVLHRHTRGGGSTILWVERPRGAQRPRPVRPEIRSSTSAVRPQPLDDSASVAAAVIAASGATSPVQCVNAAAAWWTSIDMPFAVRAPAARAATMRSVSAGW